MTRSQGVCAVGLVVTVAAMFASGHHQTPTPHPTPTPTQVVASTWQQRYADAQDALDANAMALRATPVTGQDPHRLHAQWCTAAAASNTADQHLGNANQISTKDCPKP